MTHPPRRAPAEGLVLSGLGVPFGTNHGLHPVDLALAPGERLALVGPSGEGKTTLLRAIAGLAPVDGGMIRLGGRDLAAVPAEQRDIVYLHQVPLLFPHRTVAGNVAFPLEVRGVAAPAVRARVDALLSRVGLSAMAGRPVHGLSGGQRHRVALARALAARPAVLLLDEPFAALDPTLRAEVRDAVADLLDAEGPATILVTHDVDEAASFAQRLAVLLGRHLVQDAPPGEVLRAPASVAVARFLGIPNLVAGRVDQGRFSSAIAACEWTGPDGAATLVARADAVRIEASPDGPCHVVAIRERVGGVVVEVEGPSGRLLGVARDGPPPAGTRVHVTFDAQRIHVIMGAHANA